MVFALAGDSTIRRFFAMGAVCVFIMVYKVTVSGGNKLSCLAFKGGNGIGISYLSVGIKH